MDWIAGIAFIAWVLFMCAVLLGKYLRWHNQDELDRWLKSIAKERKGVK